MSVVRAFLTGAFLTALWLPAGAAPEDYCAAYARDFADSGKRDEAVWKRRFDDATKACLAQFTPEQGAPAEKPAAPVVKEAAPEEIPALTEEAPVVADAPEAPKKKKPEKKVVEKPVKKKAVSKIAEDDTIEAPKPRKTKKTKVKKQLAAKQVEDEPFAEATPEPAVIVAPDIEAPQQPDKPKKKTLLSAFKSLVGSDEPAPKPTPQVVPASGNLQPGSAAWMNYCERKYASFNRSTGTYLSRTGVERKCKVTRN